MAKKNEKSPVVDATRDPPVKDPARAEYKPDEAKSPRVRGRADANSDEPKEDHVYGIASRARWGGDASIAELHRDSRVLEGKSVPEGTTSQETEEEEEEEEEDNSAASLTKAQLKEALDEAKVEYDPKATKDALVALYEEHNLGDAE